MHVVLVALEHDLQSYIHLFFLRVQIYNLAVDTFCPVFFADNPGGNAISHAAIAPVWDDKSKRLSYAIMARRQGYNTIFVKHFTPGETQAQGYVLQQS